MSTTHFKIKRGDTSPALRYELLPLSVTLAGASVAFSMQPAIGGAPRVARQPAVIEDESGTPTVRYEWQIGDTDAPGVYLAEFEVTYSDGAIETFPNDGFISVTVAPDIP